MDVYDNNKHIETIVNKNKPTTNGCFVVGNCIFVIGNLSKL